MWTKLNASCAIVVLTSACGGTTVDFNGFDPSDPMMNIPATTAAAVGSAAATATGTYEVTQGDTTVVLPVSNVFFNGQRAWAGAGGFRAGSYEGTDVLALGGIDDTGAAFAGITGTQTSAPDANATYTGRFSANSETTQRNAPLTLSFNLADQTVTNVGGDLTVAGTVSGAGITGTVTLDDNEADLLGGFYGTNELAGAFNGAGIGGTIFGIQDAG